MGCEVTWEVGLGVLVLIFGRIGFVVSLVPWYLSVLEIETKTNHQVVDGPGLLFVSLPRMNRDLHRAPLN
jgi:hypothetical protein